MPLWGCHTPRWWRSPTEAGTGGPGSLGWILAYPLRPCGLWGRSLNPASVTRWEGAGAEVLDPHNISLAIVVITLTVRSRRAGPGLAQSRPGVCVLNH